MAEFISFRTKEARLNSGGVMYTLYMRLPKTNETTAKSFAQIMADLTKKLVDGSAPKMTKIGIPTIKICRLDTKANDRYLLSLNLVGMSLQVVHRNVLHDLRNLIKGQLVTTIRSRFNVPGQIAH
jgi:hypothetical protein